MKKNKDILKDLYIYIYIYNIGGDTHINNYISVCRPYERWVEQVPIGDGLYQQC